MQIWNMTQHRLLRRSRLDQNACTGILLPLVLLVKRLGMADDAVPELAVPVVLKRGQSIDRCWVDIKNRRNLSDGFPFRNKAPG
jgi:hypothetical protein